MLPSVLALSLVLTKNDSTLLDYAVESRIYPENPDLMFVTMRGGGMSVWNISTAHASNPKNEFFLNVTYGVEGQDRRGSTMVVTELGDRPKSGLLVLNVSDSSGPVSVKLMARLTLSINGSLHTKIYYREADKRSFAIITSGLTHSSCRNMVTAVEITDPMRPVEVARVSTAAKCTEGVIIVDDVAFIGSYCSNEVVTISLSNLPSSMHVLQTVTNSSYENMVSAVFNSSYSIRPNGAQQDVRHQNKRGQYLFAASYANPGGLVTFNLSELAAGRIVEAGRLITHNSSRANRIHLHESKPLAFLALEKDDDRAVGGGGIAVVDISEPKTPMLLTSIHIPDESSRMYCLASSGDFLYAFGATAKAMYVYRI
jgi:hypothetical protein